MCAFVFVCFDQEFLVLRHGRCCRVMEVVVGGLLFVLVSLVPIATARLHLFTEVCGCTYQLCGTCVVGAW
jgi:hypothetical protein